MKIPRIYVDTSVIGGYFDSEFQEWSRGLIADFIDHKYKMVISEVTSAELSNAPQEILILYSKLLKISEMIHINEESIVLLEKYEKSKILSTRYRNDMLHIALATVAEVDVLVSWNFRHIVRFDKIRQFNHVNKQNGYKELSIYSPQEVTTHGKEN
jgi:predicted nucleic acid-binding protein